MKTFGWNRSRQMGARMTIALAYFAGVAAIVGWSLPQGAAADRPAQLALREPDTDGRDAATVSTNPEPPAPKPRSKVNCAGCGVIESVQRIDTHHVLMEGCGAGDFAGLRNAGHVFGGGRDNVESLADTVASLIVDRQGMTKVAVTSRHQIVVRFPDGSKQLFDEATPRTLQVGDRIKVIVPASGVRG